MIRMHLMALLGALLVSGCGGGGGGGETAQNNVSGGNTSVQGLTTPAQIPLADAK